MGAFINSNVIQRITSSATTSESPFLQLQLKAGSTQVCQWLSKLIANTVPDKWKLIRSRFVSSSVIVLLLETCVVKTTCVCYCICCKSTEMIVWQIKIDLIHGYDLIISTLSTSRSGWIMIFHQRFPEIRMIPGPYWTIYTFWWDVWHHYHSPKSIHHRHGQQTPRKAPLLLVLFRGAKLL